MNIFFWTVGIIVVAAIVLTYPVIIPIFIFGELATKLVYGKFTWEK